MEEKRVKTFYDITARRWNDIINAVNMEAEKALPRAYFPS